MVGIRTCSKVGHAEILELRFSIGIFEILAKSSGSMIQGRGVKFCILTPKCHRGFKMCDRPIPSSTLIPGKLSDCVASRAFCKNQFPNLQEYSYQPYLLTFRYHSLLLYIVNCSYCLAGWKLLNFFL